MTNEEKAELVALTACVVLGMVVRRSATNARAQVRFGLRREADVRAAVLEALESRAAVAVKPEPSVPLKTVVPGVGNLADSVREFLGTGAKRQVTIEEGLHLAPGALDGLLVEDNGFSVNAQGWVRVMEAASV